MPNIVNIAGYQFVSLTNLPELRERLLRQCKAWRLKGTILLSTEGINPRLFGTRFAHCHLLVYGLPN